MLTTKAISRALLSSYLTRYIKNINSVATTLLQFRNGVVDFVTELSRVTWGMTAPGGKTAPLPVDNLKLPRTFSEYTEWCYHLTDTCFERSTPRSRRKLHRCQPSRNRAGNPAFWLISRIPAFLRKRPAFLALFQNKKNH